MFTSLNLLKPLGEVISLVGEPMRAAGWYGHTNGLHTVSMSVQNFTGRISVQAAITTTPVDSDWFSVLPNAAPYIQYPQTGYVIQSPATGETSNFGFSFTSNIVWIRASMDRSYFLPSIATPIYIGMFGLIDYVLVKFGNNLGENHYAWPLPEAPEGPMI